jgi:gamma-glutamyltranspeptidase / glutathione hydrolase
MNTRKDLLKNRNQNRSTVIAQNGMVCSGNPLASAAGIDALKAGGNAIDAAICTNAMLSVVEPLFCGPGGDLFAILWIEKERKLYGLNASGRSPYEWNIEKAHALGWDKIPLYHPLSWSVPGCVSGWEALSRRFGSLGWAELFSAAERYAAEGFPVSPVVTRYWDVGEKGFPDLARTFFPNARVPQIGEVFRNPDLAAVFAVLGEDGPDAFYRGEIADKIAAYSQKVGGLLNKRDLEDHTCEWVDPVSVNYKGYEVWEIPPSTQGIAALQMLNILEGFSIDSLSPDSPEYLHLLIESKKIAYEDRATYYADPDFSEAPLERLLSKEYAKERAALIDFDRAATSVPLSNLDQPSDTTYLTAADGEGNMVSLIQSNSANFGSKFVPDGLGFAMQNRGQFFSLDPKHRNRLEPHKRPFHTIIPAFVTKDAAPVFSFGVLGGGFQPQGHVQILMNLFEFGMSVQQAGECPRVAHWGSSAPDGGTMVDGGRVVLEPGLPAGTAEALATKGHTVAGDMAVNGGYQGIWREEGPLRYFGGTDPRFDGCAIGY